MKSLRVAPLFVIAALSLPNWAQANTITVTSNADVGSPGVCVLRDAITAANTDAAVNGCAAGSNGTNTIGFALPAANLTITPNTVLPTITTQVIINGYTQSGALANTLASASNATIKVSLDGSNVPCLNNCQDVYGLTLGAGSSGSTIKGLSIGNFGTGGILIKNSSNNTIAGNFIGVSAAGTVAKGNGSLGYRSGVYLLGDAINVANNSNTIGGSNPADRNVISANSTGVGSDAYGGGTVTNTQIIGNIIGHNKAGTALVGFQGNAMRFSGAGISDITIGSTTGVTPGGACSGGCNLIAGYYGIDLEQMTTGTVTVQGNVIGLNAAGTQIPSGVTTTQTAIIIQQSDNTFVIGGTTPAQRNVISGMFYGTEIQNANHTASITIEGNYYGTTTDGQSAASIGSSSTNVYGIHVYNSDGVTIGGTVAGAGNVISGHSYSGINLEGATHTLIQGNRIGSAAAGVSDVGNGHEGIRIGYGNVSADNNTIGATTSGGAGGNLIAFNGQLASGAYSGGIFVTGTGNRISTNSIFSNSGDPLGLGIDLNDDGVTPNTAACTAPSTGSNRGQNYPVNIGFASNGVSTHVNGEMIGAASTQYTIEFYANVTGDDSGYGEGQTYIGSTQVTTSPAPNCNVAFNVTLGVPVGASGTVSAIAISAAGDTSEFSQSVDRIFANGYE